MFIDYYAAIMHLNCQISVLVGSFVIFITYLKADELGIRGNNKDENGQYDDYNIEESPSVNHEQIYENTRIPEIEYELPPFLKGTPIKMKNEFKKIWETGVRTLTRQQLADVIENWIDSKNDETLKEKYEAYKQKVQNAEKQARQATQLIVKSMTPSVKEIWIKHFQPVFDFDEVQKPNEAEIPVSHHLARLRGIFESLDPEEQLEIQRALGSIASRTGGRHSYIEEYGEDSRKLFNDGTPSDSISSNIFASIWPKHNGF